MDRLRQLNTTAVDLLAPSDRFVSTSRLYGQLHRWWILLGRYWWVTAAVLALVTVPIWLITLKGGPLFESKGRMWLTGKLDIYEGRLYTEELINFLGTQAELLRSPTIQRRALDRFYEEFKTNSPATTKPRDGTPANSTQNEQPAVDGLRVGQNSGTNSPAPLPFKVEVQEGSKSSTLELRAYGKDPRATRAFLNCLMREYLSFKREAREDTSDRTSASLATEVTQLKSELEAQQNKLHDFQSSNNVVLLQQQGNSAANYLASLNRKLADLRGELRWLQLLKPEQWIEMKTNHPDLTPSDGAEDETGAREMLASLAGPQLELLKANQQVALLKARRDDLSKALRPQHPKIVKLTEDIATQEKIAQIARDQAVKQMAHRRRALELQVTNLAASVTEWDARALVASRKMADYEQLQQNLQRVQTAYDKTLTLIQTVDIGKKVEQENVGILEGASVALPIHRLFRNTAIALAGSFVLAFGILYCIALFQDDFTSLSELANQLSEEVIGQVPAISAGKSRGRPGIDALGEKHFEFLEAFRSIRSSLLFMNNGGAKPKTIVIASSIPAEGKSTVALYLAATLARGNSRVLLVDGDMRRATLHTQLGVPAGPGLAEVLDQSLPYGDGIVPTQLKNLSLLPAGEARRNPGELVLSPAWADFLSGAKAQFDYVIVDTPPILATNDATVLAPNVDGVLFVVRRSFTSARMARGALHALRQRHVHMLGLIFNGTVSSPYERQYYHHYRSSHHRQPNEPWIASLPNGNPPGTVAARSGEPT